MIRKPCRENTDATWGLTSTINLTTSDGKQSHITAFLGPFMTKSYIVAKASVSAALEKLKSN
jgi:hypothetical protein